MEFLKYKTVKLLIVALVLALVAIPFDEIDFVFMTLRLISFAILMYVFVKLTSAKKKVKK
jgi:threonine/homoserine/homoserine lactone efflux protein